MLSPERREGALVVVAGPSGTGKTSRMHEIANIVLSSDTSHGLKEVVHIGIQERPYPDGVQVRKNPTAYIPSLNELIVIEDLRTPDATSLALMWVLLGAKVIASMSSDLRMAERFQLLLRNDNLMERLYQLAANDQFGHLMAPLYHRE